MIDVVLTALATFAVCKIISEYDGPFSIFHDLRNRFKLFSCLACSSVWVGVLFALFTHITFIEYFAAIGIVLIIDRMAA